MTAAAPQRPGRVLMLLPDVLNLFPGRKRLPWEAWMIFSLIGANFSDLSKTCLLLDGNGGREDLMASLISNEKPCVVLGTTLEVVWAA